MLGEKGRKDRCQFIPVENSCYSNNRGGGGCPAPKPTSQEWVRGQCGLRVPVLEPGLDLLRSGCGGSRSLRGQACGPLSSFCCLCSPAQHWGLEGLVCGCTCREQGQEPVQAVTPLGKPITRAVRGRERGIKCVFSLSSPLMQRVEKGWGFQPLMSGGQGDP